MSTGFSQSEDGSQYSYFGIKRNTQLLICSIVGKWNQETCDSFYEKLARRVRFPTRKRRITLFSDGNAQNNEGIRKHFPQGSVNYGMKKKVHINGTIVGVVYKKIFGNPELNNISITQMDGFCSKLRERISCFTRKARSFAKRKTSLENRLEIFGTQHNFIETKQQQTPAMREGITHKILSWKDILHTRLSYLS